MYKIKSLGLVALAILVGGVFLSAEAQKRMAPVLIDPPPIFIDPPPVVLTVLSGSYTDAVNGNQLSTGEVELNTGATYGWTCYGSTEGDLSGFLFISMNYTSDYSVQLGTSLDSVSSVTGGSWSKLIFVNGLYAGSVYGKIVSGQLIKTEGMTSINLELTADDGTGDYVGNIGTGVFEGVLDQNSKESSVTGKLVLRY